ncbi:chromosome segregation protein SMC [Pseudooceanicola aestuarii]|uniref:chromosome segregation protein SMC n=1 Tax=Pseudooceanicola aestuarii TaxID=2697319 RepID=UPI0013D332F4|nr:chromosome segregation protein SMC [Pseudooceanicola aestuarii]
MRFSRLRLTGFKSFVDPTDLIIGTGLTGVVGPNGCGKSNLLEALRWVMGENRPTAMRGGGMEDVIFAGAATRPARNFAEVALQIDNSERLAPAGFNDGDQLDIVRRITRDVGSAYKANARDVRARDVQMLFADASTGAHSPSLVRQGQISELINAKPKNRRRILEEAAGISGLYARRHEAELKLKGAEQNLARVDDVVEQLAQQIAQLERQARQAKRYRTIGEELRQVEGMLLYRRWKEAEEARNEAQAILRDRMTVAAQGERLAREAEAAREVCEAALPPLREEDAIAGALLQRLQVERDSLTEEQSRAETAIANLTARIAQLSRDGDRETGLNRDAEETIARLDEEAAALARAGEGHDARLAQAAEEAKAASDALSDREGELTEKTEDSARLSARHQSARRWLDDSRRTLARSEAEAEKARRAMADSRDVVTRAAETFETLQAQEGAARTAAEAAETGLAQADTARAECQTQEAEARAARSGAEGEVSALQAEVAALDRLVRRDTAEGGQVMDAVKVAPGYEKALGAALADDLRVPLVAADGPSGWVALADYDAAPKLPQGMTPLADFVTVPPVLARRIAQIGVVAAEDGPALQSALRPGQRLVSQEGDLWRWDGFRAWAEDAPSAAALRLEQINRLTTLRQEAAEAETRAAAARTAHETLAADLSRLTEADKAARRARADADRQLADAARKLSRAEADRTLAESRLESLGLAVSRHEADAEAAAEQLAEAEAAMQVLPDLDAARAALDAVKTAVDAARGHMMALRTAHDELRREGEARSRRSREIVTETDSWRTRLQSADSRISELDQRRREAEADLAEARDLPDMLADRHATLSDQIAVAEGRKANAVDALSVAETHLRDAVQAEREAERTASEAREARARADARADAAQEGVETAAERIAEALEMSPKELLQSLDAEVGKMPGVTALEADVTRLRRQRDALGAVNLRAEEDASEVGAEHETLTREKADLEDAIRTLRGGISGLNREGRERLLTAFEQVNSNFSLLFRHLFGGGEASLMLVESDDPLEAGLEIMCQPPGKKLSVLSLLSGGEQTLTALALIFGVFLANPAPICVLDEVDAPLDDANVTRFCDLLDEMCRQTETRFLIITHHAVTMARMDRLFGVTMQEQGVSQLVSVDLKKAEQMVA